MDGKALKAFSERMHIACDRMGLPSERGRIAGLAQRFKVTPNAARKWLLGEGMPELALAVEIAKQAKVQVQWLLQGCGQMELVHSDNEAITLKDALDLLPPADRREIADFMRYKIERAPVLGVNEEAKRFLVSRLSSMVDAAPV